MEQSKIASYAGSLISIVFGAALLWTPPIQLAGQIATVGLAVAFVTAGLAALGVTVAVPMARAAAYREGVQTTLRTLEATRRRTRKGAERDA